MDFYVPFPDMTPSTILSFSAQTQLPTSTPAQRRQDARQTLLRIRQELDIGSSSSHQTDTYLPSEFGNELNQTSSMDSQRAIAQSREVQLDELSSSPEDTVGTFHRRTNNPSFAFRKALEGELEMLSDQEDRVYRAEANLRSTGEDVLVPIGRIQTAMESAQARSESPSDTGGPDLMPEDFGFNGQIPGGYEDGQEGFERSGEEEEGPQDLDADMEDRDVSEEMSGEMD